MLRVVAKNTVCTGPGQNSIRSTTQDAETKRTAHENQCFLIHDMCQTAAWINLLAANRTNLNVTAFLSIIRDSNRHHCVSFHRYSVTSFPGRSLEKSALSAQFFFNAADHYAALDAAFQRRVWRSAAPTLLLIFCELSRIGCPTPDYQWSPDLLQYRSGNRCNPF